MPMQRHSLMKVTAEHKTVENLVAQGADTFIEVGPGKTLSGLVKKINTQVRVFHVEDAQTLAQVKKELL